MNRLKYWLLGIGIVISLAGLMCLPLGQGISPKRDTSFFYAGADAGAFLNYTFWMIAVGIVIILCSLLIRKKK